jgi:hypothetical protein
LGFRIGWIADWGWDFRVSAWPCDWNVLVSYLTIEDEKKEKRGRRSLRGSVAIPVFGKRLWRSRLSREVTLVFDVELSGLAFRKQV